MWVVTTTGFYSAVATPDGRMMVRCRVREDAEALSEFLDDSPPVLETMHADYPFRVICRPQQWAEFLEWEASRIDYSNFKDEVTRVQGQDRHNIYTGVWGALRRLESLWVPE